MRPVKTQFQRDGYEFTRVWRRGNVAIYEQRLDSTEEPSAWEVVIIRQSKAHPRDPNQDDVETYPTVNEWGKRGWTCLTLQQAREKALSLLGNP